MKVVYLLVQMVAPKHALPDAATNYNYKHTSLKILCNYNLASGMRVVFNHNMADAENVSSCETAWKKVTRKKNT